LAHLLRLGILPTGYIHPPAERTLHGLARKRVQPVRSRTQHVQAVENILARSTGSRPSAAAIKRLAPSDIGTLGLAADVALAGQANLAVISTLNLGIGRIDARRQEGTKLRPDHVRLKSIPGIGEVLAIVIMLETGDVTRFARVGNFASYARYVVSARYFNGKKKDEGNTKNGNPPSKKVGGKVFALDYGRLMGDPIYSKSTT
jgi:transposase